MNWITLSTAAVLCFFSVFTQGLPHRPHHGSNDNFTTYNRSRCQSLSAVPGQYCPKGTLIVSNSYSKANFATIQSAIASLPNDDTPQTILILAGNYTELLNVTRPGPVYLLGQTTNAFNASSNLVTVYASVANHGQLSDNAFATILTVAPNLNASLTGSGPTGFPVPQNTPFGCTDFRTYNIDFRNIFSEQSAGPSQALGISRANAGFYFSGFYSYQDTIYIGKLGNAYFYKSVIAGQTDFLYGFGTAWITNSAIQMRGCGGGITAWKGTNTTFVNKYGVYIVDSTVMKANASLNHMVGKCALGRPWNSLHRSIFAHCYLDDSIIPAGYIDWNDSNGNSKTTNQTLMAEYQDYGPGYNATGRASERFDHVLSASQYAPYSSPSLVFQTPSGAFGNTGWIDPNPEASYC